MVVVAVLVMREVVLKYSGLFFLRVMPSHLSLDGDRLWLYQCLTCEVQASVLSFTACLPGSQLQRFTSLPKETEIVRLRKLGMCSPAKGTPSLSLPVLHP